MDREPASRRVNLTSRRVNFQLVRLWQTFPPVAELLYPAIYALSLQFPCLTAGRQSPNNDNTVICFLISGYWYLPPREV